LKGRGGGKTRGTRGTRETRETRRGRGDGEIREKKLIFSWF